MNTHRVVWSALLLLGLSLPVNAGTLVEVRGEGGERTVSRMQGERIRSETGEQGTYLLLDAGRKTAYLVNDAERSVMDLSAVMWGMDGGAAAGRKPKVRLVKQGTGPRIAGYDTVHYKVMVGETDCGDEYLAAQALADASLRRFGEVMSRMTRSGQEMSGGVTGVAQDPCDGDEGALFDTYLKSGMPMRSVHSDGSLMHEVTRIERNVSMADSEFLPPQGYAVMSMEQMMQGVMQGMPAGQNQPETPEIDMNDVQKLRQQAEEQIKKMMEQMHRDGGGGMGN